MPLGTTISRMERKQPDKARRSSVSQLGLTNEETTSVSSCVTEVVPVAISSGVANVFAQPLSGRFRSIRQIVFLTSLMPAGWTRATEAQAALIVTCDVWLDRLLYVHSYPNVRESLLVWNCADPLTTVSAPDV